MIKDESMYVYSKLRVERIQTQNTLSDSWTEYGKVGNCCSGSPVRLWLAWRRCCAAAWPAAVLAARAATGAAVTAAATARPASAPPAARRSQWRVSSPGRSAWAPAPARSVCAVGIAAPAYQSPFGRRSRDVVHSDPGPQPRFRAPQQLALAAAAAAPVPPVDCVLLQPGPWAALRSVQRCCPAAEHRFCGPSYSPPGAARWHPRPPAGAWGQPANGQMPIEINMRQVLDATFPNLCLTLRAANRQTKQSAKRPKTTAIPLGITPASRQGVPKHRNRPKREWNI